MWSEIADRVSFLNPPLQNLASPPQKRGGKEGAKGRIKGCHVADRLGGSEWGGKDTILHPTKKQVEDLEGVVTSNASSRSCSFPSFSTDSSSFSSITKEGGAF